MTLYDYYAHLEEGLTDSYYSVVRFCPDPARGEQINIAVILESPEFGYVGTKIRRNMTRLIKNFAPHIDHRIIIDFAKGIEVDLSARPTRMEAQPLLPNPENPIHINQLCSTINNSMHTMWQVSPPRHMAMVRDIRWEDELNHLYAIFLSNFTRPADDNWDKQKVQSYSYSHLRQRDVTLDLNPTPIPGEVYDNEFDAQFEKDEMFGHFQFFSYDTSDPDLNQMIRFLGSVEDARDSGFRESEGHFYVPIIKRPSSPSGQVKFQKAENYCAKKKVRIMVAEDKNYDLIATAFKERNGDLLTRL